MTGPTTSGLPSWARSEPVEKLQTGRSWATFAVDTWSSGLYRVRALSRPADRHSPGGGPLTTGGAGARWALREKARTKQARAVVPPREPARRAVELTAAAILRPPGRRAGCPP